MARGVNKVILVGSLGRDPEVKYGANGNAIASMTLATSEQWKDKNSGESKEKTEWHRTVAFGRTAEVIGEYLKKGSQIYVEGKLQTRKWQDQNGQDRYTTEVVINDMQMLGGRNTQESGSAGNPAPHNAGSGAKNTSPSASTEGNQFNDFEDDGIPFISCEFNTTDKPRKRKHNI